MKTIFRKTLALFVAAILLVGTPVLYAYAEYGCGEAGTWENGKDERGYRGSRGKHYEKMMDEVGLTDAQKEELKAYKETQKTEMKELNEALKANRTALREELKKYDSDQGRVNKIVAEQKKLQGQMIDQRVASFQNMKKIMTPEQYNKLTELKETKKQEWREKKGEKGKRFFKR